MTDNPVYEVHRIDFLNHPASAGLPDEFVGEGVIQAREKTTGARFTFLVEHDYAITALTARMELAGVLTLAISAIRWARLGWPAEWAAGTLLPTWESVYPIGWTGA